MSSYVGAEFDWDSGIVKVWERNEEGRVLRNFPASWYFYVPDEDGEYTSIYNDKLKRLDFDSRDEMNIAGRQYRRKFESDIQPHYKALMERYYNLPTPTVNFAFLDIEVDYKSKLGFSSPANPYAPINAVTVYQSWTKKYLTYAVPPPGWDGTLPTVEQQKSLKFGFEMNLVICNDEMDLLVKLVADIQDADIISGWNSEFFDLPYIIKRLIRVAPYLAPKMSFIGAKAPKEGSVERFGTPNIVYKLSGRTHLDYLDLFKKFTFEGRTSYSLGNIASEELDIPKLHYEGTLEQLYNNDFAWFCLYNARDVEVLVKLDEKFNFIQLVNQMAHENTVLFESMLGTVRYVETGIANRAHNVHRLIVPDKQMSGKNDKVEGAIVMTPKYGLHEWLGSVDLASLYPTTMRALNMSIETYLGQFENEENDWRGIIANDDVVHTAHMADGGVISDTGANWNAYIRSKGYALSAFGTLFSQDRPGMVADALTYWFGERKALQAEKKKWGKEVDLLKRSLGEVISEQDLDVLLSDGSVKYFKYKDKETDLWVHKVCSAEDWEKISAATKQEEHYDLLQLTKKIQLNSTYGALLNEAFRFGRREIGASVTATGRAITTHMIQTIGELLTGEFHPVEKRYSVTKKADGKNFVNSRKFAKWVIDKEWDKLDAVSRVPIENMPVLDDADEEEDIGNVAFYFTRSEAIIYGDTDSCYFKTFASNKEEAVAVADEVAKLTNESFPAFMSTAFNCHGGRESLMKAAREIVGSRGVFLSAKKKYTIRVVDKEGKATDELKTMGSEMKKADTPKVVQDFLKGVMGLILDGQDYKTIEKYVNEQRKSLVLKVENPIVLGVSKQINNLNALYAEWQRTEKIGKGKTKLPGHVRAAVNYNEMIQLYDEGAKFISSGDKGIIFYLKPNMHKLKSIAFPADTEKFPPWFDEHFSVDRKLTEEKMIDSKLSGTFEALGWDVPTPQNTLVNSILKF